MEICWVSGSGDWSWISGTQTRWWNTCSLISGFQHVPVQLNRDVSISDWLQLFSGCRWNFQKGVKLYHQLDKGCATSCDEDVMKSLYNANRTCCTSLQVQQFHTLFHHLRTHSKLILTACIALLFKNPWLEWGSCRSEAKVHPSFPRSASIYPIFWLFLFPSKYFTTHQFTISPQDWGQILICGLATSKFNPRRSKKKRWPSWPFWRCSIQSWASAIIQA